MAYELSALVSAVGSGLIAGLCFAFAAFLMRSFDRLGAPAAIRTMQAINAGILRSSAMVVWFATALVSLLAVALAEDRTLPVAAAALYWIGAILITGRGNVPLNEELERVDPDELDASGAEEAWRRYRVRWGRWNALRTVACGLASAGFALAL